MSGAAPASSALGAALKKTVLIVVALMVLGLTPAQAHEEPLIQPGLIQPGAAVQLSGSVGGPYGQCTLNVVFRDARHTYIGTVAQCAQQLGERAAMAGRESVPSSSAL